MYSTEVVQKKVYIPINVDTEEEETIPMRFIRIKIRHDKGEAFEFSVSRRKGVLTFRDSRDKMGYTLRTIKPELSRMLGEKRALALITEAIG